MAKDTGIVTIHNKDYKTVALRVSEFREKHADFSLITEPLETGDTIIFRASILDASGRILATGHAEERRGSSQINKTSALENCETGAIGRALACFGYGGSEFASADEVANAIHQQNAPSSDTKSDNRPQAVKDAEYISGAIQANDRDGLQISISSWDRARLNRAWKQLSTDQQQWVTTAMTEEQQ